jgi:hypothetical protein
MIEGQDVIHLFSAGQPTKADLAQILMGVFFIRSVSGTMFAMISFPEMPADSCRPQSEKHFIR